MWWRVDCLKNLLESGVEFVAFLDSDSFIKRFVDLRQALPEGFWLGLCASPYAHYRDPFHLNFGVSYWRSCQESIAFLEEVQKFRKHMTPQEAEYHEQGCINHLLLDDTTRGRWQKGFMLLGGEWSSHPVFEKHVEKAYVVGAHGTHDDIDKLIMFQELLERFPLVEMAA